MLFLVWYDLKKPCNYAKMSTGGRWYEYPYKVNKKGDSKALWVDGAMAIVTHDNNIKCNQIIQTLNTNSRKYLAEMEHGGLYKFSFHMKSIIKVG